jgi:myo-inositol 2-dehydrogenase/D-chiro-inositol 1-dehydrogenase
MVTVKNNTPDNHILFDRSGVNSSLPLNFFMDRYVDSFWNEMQAFVQSILNNKPVPVSGHDGLMAVVMGLAAGVSARENRPVRLTEIQPRRLAPCKVA